MCAGRWQKNKDPYWYTKEKESAEDANVRRENEMAMVKQREQDLMMEALGLKPKAPKHTMMSQQQPRLDQEDMQKLLGKGAGDDFETPGEGGERVKGLGFNASRTNTGAIQMGADEERLDGMGIGRATGGGAPPPPLPSSFLAAAAAGVPSGTHSNHHRGLTRDEIDELKRKQRKKEEKKEAKRAEKEAKREKKEAKREKKHSARHRSRRSRSRSPARRHRRDRSRSGSSESEGGDRRSEEEHHHHRSSSKSKREHEKYEEGGREKQHDGRGERRERSREREGRRRR